MIEIRVTEKDDDSFDVYFGVKATDRSQYVDQVKSILDDLYHADKDLFVEAIIDSDFGKMVSSK